MLVSIVTMSFSGLRGVQRRQTKIRLPALAQLFICPQYLFAVRPEIQRTIAPFVDQHHQEDEDEYAHSYIACPAQLFKSNGP